ncbi:transglycosylase domain-containing protein [Streptomyces durmitorensis]|uniref:Penicillin-binding protein n=1 Tax=Streptomyces durmitorensis TaxID=319947 RepID=A0ABY4PYP4_9ACTN|nr:transglycosylase domain-containing protein [Streptomyces durmitorensis]UQT57973.1 penicillin-binding protein [Streptomyces durmitorensis]
MGTHTQGKPATRRKPKHPRARKPRLSSLSSLRLHRLHRLHLRRRLIDYPRHGRRGIRRWIPSWRQGLGSLTLTLSALGCLFALVYASVDIPDENATAQREANVYYWADGTQMVSTGEVNRQNVRLSEIPDAVENAVIAAENDTFYSDSGVSPKGLARAAVNMVRGQETQGGSTITQQYVKNTYLSQDQTVTRKVKEFVIALKVDRKKSKREILQGYLNTSWFGRGAYGIEAAAHAYYGIPARQLNPSQGAALAALLKGAEQYDPSVSEANHRRSVARWKWILDRQVRSGLMKDGVRAKFTVYPEPQKESRTTSLGGQTGYLVDVANKYVKQHTTLTDKDLAHGGYKIHTTFDKDKVRSLKGAVERVVERDIDPKKRPADKGVQVGAASVRPSDGAIVALYGGADATRHFTNNADTSGVPVGSAFKPFVLASALEHGLRTSAGRSTRWQPVSTGSFYGDDGLLQGARSDGSGVAAPTPTLGSGTSGPDSAHPTLRRALAKGGNATYVRLGKDVGLERVRRTAVSSGLLEDSMARLEKTFPIGTSTPSAIRMAGAYSTFVNRGLQHDPYSVTKVVKDDETVGGLARPGARRALDPDVADEVAGAMRGVGASSVQRPVVAGRTGDQDRLRSAWFTASTEELSTAVTMFRTSAGGQAQLMPMSGVGGARSQHGNVFPVRIWQDYVNSPSTDGGS